VQTSVGRDRFVLARASGPRSRGWLYPTATVSRGASGARSDGTPRRPRPERPQPWLEALTLANRPTGTRAPSRRAMVAHTRRGRFCVEERNPPDRRWRRGPTAPRTRSDIVSVGRARVKPRSVEEHEARERYDQNPPRQPRDEHQRRELLTRSRDQPHEQWKEERDENPGEPWPEPRPATTRRTTRGGVELATWKHDTEKGTDRAGLDQEHHHHDVHAAKLPLTPRHRERARWTIR
jgi:hypothetical protein